MNGDPRHLLGRLFDACIGVLVAAMALYGAVYILQAIWLWLCLIAAVVGIGFVVWWVVSTRYRGW